MMIIGLWAIKVWSTGSEKKPSASVFRLILFREGPTSIKAPATGIPLFVSINRSLTGPGVWESIKSAYRGRNAHWVSSRAATQNGRARIYNFAPGVFWKMALNSVIAWLSSVLISAVSSRFSMMLFSSLGNLASQKARNSFE